MVRGQSGACESMNDNPMKLHLDLATDIHSLPFFAVCVCHRPGMLTLTGQVGEVQEKSAQIALSWIRAHAHELQVSCVFLCFLDCCVLSVV